MLREYKFRGWDATGQKGWVYGDLVHNKKVTKTGLEDRVMVGGYEVVPESVGLWTGLHDKNGKEIYEGDIVDNSWCFASTGIVCFGEYQHLDAQNGYKNGDLGFYIKHLGETASIIRPDILFFANNCEVIGTIYEQNNKKQYNGIFAKKLHDCDLSVRSLICLKSADIETVGDLCRRKMTDLLCIRNFGKKSLCEIKDFLHDNGLEFDMNI